MARTRTGGDMAANIGPHKVASAAAERAEIRSAVRHHDPVIRDLYASDGSYAAIRGGEKAT